MSKDKTATFVWGITIALVVCMLGAAVFISVKNKPRVDDRPPSTDIAQQTGMEQNNPLLKAKELSLPKLVKKEIPEPAPQIEPTPRENVTARPVPAVPQKTKTEAQEEALNKRVTSYEDATLDLSRIAGNMSVKTKLDGMQGNKFPLRYTCYRNNISPPVSWDGAPMNTKSLVVFLEKANEGEDVVTHWMLFNISPEKTDLPEDITPPQSEGMIFGENYFDNPEYAGPCEPKEKQNYRIRVFALDTVLDLPVGVKRNLLIRAMNGHVLDMAEFKFLHYM